MIDSIHSVVRDSAHIHDAIVSVVTPIVTAIPDATPVISVFKALALMFGSAITGACIHWFGVRNSKKH